MNEFVKFNKIARLNRDCVITEKIDGTNAQIFIGGNGEFKTGSRNRWITPENDNAGFSRWAHENKEELMKLGEGRHFGEWWGSGIQRRYGLSEKRFSLFNTGRWNKGNIPKCCYIVPVLYTGNFNTEAIDQVINSLATIGSMASPGFSNPEGIVIFHVPSGYLFKKTIKNDDKPKSEVK